MKEFKTRTDPIGRKGDLGIIDAVYTHDEYDLEALKKSGAELQMVLDVGGHIGSFGAKINELWPGAKVIAFEPNPESVHLYQQNVEAMIVPCAVSYDPNRNCLADDVECPGSGILTKPEDLRSDGTFLTDAASFAGREHRISVEGVKTVTLEQVLKGFTGQIDLLKLDCEGSEIDILKNLSEGVARKVRRIVGEYHYGPGFEKFAEIVRAKFPKFDVTKTREYTSSRGGFAASKRLPKVRLVHMLCLPDREVEKQSVASLAALASYGIDYVQQINPRATRLPAMEALFPTGQWGQPLRPEYYGVWAAHRRAFEEGFSSDVDFLLVCEGDCFLEVPPEIFVRRLQECAEVIEKERLFYFSFGEAVDPISGARQSQVVREIGTGAFVTDKIIRCHCVIFPKAARDFWLERFGERKWYSADIWYNAILQTHGKPMGIVTERLASQQDDRRESLLDEKNEGGPFVKVYQGIERRKEAVENITCNFIDGPHVNISGTGGVYDVSFVDEDANECVYKSQLAIEPGPGLFSRAFRQYFTRWRINVTREGKTVFEERTNLAGKRVYLAFDSRALGDTLAWFPFAEEFRLKHKCQVIVSTFSWNNLFRKTYPEIEFVEPGEQVPNLYAKYVIGCLTPTDRNLSPWPWYEQPLQAIAAGILGLPHQEIRPKLAITPKRWKDRRYVCIGTETTARAKFWLRDGGWEAVIDWLREQGYTVLNISKNPRRIEGAFSLGEIPIEEVAGYLAAAEFFIGLPSGLSWLAWALKVPVVMVSGFSPPWVEFQEGRVHVGPPPGKCNGCYATYDRGFDSQAMGFCPRLAGTSRAFECTTSITPEAVILAAAQLTYNHGTNNDRN